MMAKADMHVHSSLSSRPSEWFLQRLGTKESYTDPETIYREAKRHGMKFVTITDHNEIKASVALKERYPDEVITGVEVTTYFPENGCKAHILVYGLSEAQFALINRLRHDIYELRACLKEMDLAYAVAHATFSINKKLTLDTLERLILMFDCFEGINGSRSRMGNEVLVEALEGLTPEVIDRLHSKYRIEPYSENPWIKGFTGGSDDHSGLFIAKAFTEAEAETQEEFLAALKARRTRTGGSHNNYQGLAFALYKVAYDFSKSKSDAWSSSVLGTMNGLIFEDKAMTMKHRLMFTRLRRRGGNHEDGLTHHLCELVELIRKEKEASMSERLEMVYQKIAEIADDLLVKMLKDMEKVMREGDLVSVIRHFCAAMPGFFLAAPFFTTMSVLHSSRILLNELRENYGLNGRKGRKRLLWFTDLVDVEHISACASLIVGSGAAGRSEEVELMVVSCGLEEAEGKYEPGVSSMNLPGIGDFELTGFEAFSVRVPSVLGSLKMIYECDPDLIVVGTPGPVGFLGLLAARLLHVGCTCVYQPSLAEAVKRRTEDEMVCNALEDFTCWVYSLGDRVLVPGDVSADALEKKGYRRERLEIPSVRSATDMPWEEDGRWDRTGAGEDRICGWKALSSGQ